MKHETAGDPITGLKWTRRTTEKIAEELGKLGIDVSANTVAKLLKQMGFSLRFNHKKLSHGPQQDRDEQFTYIAQLRECFTLSGDPIVSVDTKKRELVGCFKNAGTTWSREPVAVNDHDFRSLASGIAIPYGIYDLQANRASVFVGTSHDTPHFAVDNLEKWWRYDGQRRYPATSRLLILADSGGSNGFRSRAWKYWLQNRLADRHRLSVTVCHYPAGASKWNPIDTDSSARSARTGQAGPSTTKRPCSSTSAPPPPQPASASKPTSPHEATPTEKRSATNAWPNSASTPMTLNRHATIRSIPASAHKPPKSTLIPELALRT